MKSSLLEKLTKRLEEALAVTKQKEDNVLYMTDESGNEVAFEVLDVIFHEEEEYIVLLPVEEKSEEAGRALILRFDCDNGEDVVFACVDDDAVVQTVFDIFVERNEDIYTFVD